MPDLLSGRLVAPDSLIPLVRQRVSGPLDSFIKQAIVKAAITFCHESQYVYIEREFTELLEGQTIEFAAGSSLNRQARQDVSTPQITTAVIHKITQEGEPLTAGIHYHQHSADLIRFLVPLVNVKIYGAIEPIPGAVVIPSELVKDYAEELADGAAYELLMQHSKPWADPNKATMHFRYFNEAIRDAYRMRIESTPNARVANAVRQRTFY